MSATMRVDLKAEELRELRLGLECLGIERNRELHARIERLEKLGESF